MQPSLANLRMSMVTLDRWVRNSLDHVKTWVPRWKPWSPQRVLAVTATFGLAMLALVIFAPASVRSFVWRLTHAGQAPPTQEGPIVSPAPPTERADAKFDRKGRHPIFGNVMTIPPSFSSEDGAYDLVVHFHGNTDLVEDSFAVAGVNAAVVIVNVGNGSGPYEERFANPDVMRIVSMRVHEDMVRRGLQNARQRRLAFTAWSAGYGAVIRMLENAALADQVDAVILLDGIHAGYDPSGKEIDPGRLAPFAKFAERAKRGEKLMVITHTEIQPIEYPGTRETTDALLRLLGVTRGPAGQGPEMPSLASTHGIPKSKIVPLAPKSETRATNLIVRGFGGDQPEDHMMHLLYMAPLGLKDLTDRWKPRGS